MGDERVRLRPPPRGRGDRLVDDAAEAEPGRRGARARQGGHRDRAADRPARDGEGAAARLQPRSRGGQAGVVRGAPRRRGSRSAALAVLVDGLEFDRERLAAAAADPLLLATDAAEALVAEGVPFRDAHEQVAAQVRAGTFDPPSPRDRSATSPPRSPPRRSAGRDDTDRRLARRPRLPALGRPRPRPRRRRSSIAPSSCRAEPKQPLLAGRDARALLRQALDADPHLVHRRHGPARRDARSR